MRNVIEWARTAWNELSIVTSDTVDGAIEELKALLIEIAVQALIRLAVESLVNHASEQWTEPHTEESQSNDEDVTAAYAAREASDELEEEAIAKMFRPKRPQRSSKNQIFQRPNRSTTFAAEKFRAISLSRTRRKLFLRVFEKLKGSMEY